MIIAFLTGVLLGLYMAIIAKYWQKYKTTKHAPYARFIFVVSVSILGPACVYLLRVLYGTGIDGDPPLTIVAIFGTTALTIFFAYLVYQSKQLAHDKKYNKTSSNRGQVSNRVK